MLCEESITMTQFCPPGIKKQHTVLIDIHIWCANTNISLRSCINLMTVHRIQKGFDESNNHWEGRACWKPHSVHSHKKRTPEFADEIHLIIDNDPSTSIKSKTNDFGAWQFTIKSMMRTFGLSHASWKRARFIAGHEKQEERTFCKVF